MPERSAAMVAFRRWRSVSKLSSTARPLARPAMKSSGSMGKGWFMGGEGGHAGSARLSRRLRDHRATRAAAPRLCAASKLISGAGHRSEEHTSELQSHLNLVCRLLLEKKKK